MRSDPLKKGINAAPQRALLKALGLCDAETSRQGTRRPLFCSTILPSFSSVFEFSSLLKLAKEGVIF